MEKYMLIVLLTGLSACGIYRQNVVNAPLMQQKGQTQIGGHISFNGLEGQAGYALTKKIALLANYADMGTRKEEYSANNYEIRKHNFKEIAAGMYKNTASGRIRELYILAGKGMTSRFRTGQNAAGVIYQSKQEVNYNRFVIQADFGAKNKKYQTIISPRLLSVHYYNIVDDIGNEYKEISNFHVYAEGAFTFRYHILEFLMISAQGDATIPLIYSRGVHDYYEFSPFNASIGLIFNEGLLKRQK